MLKNKLIYWGCVTLAIILVAWLIKSQTSWFDKWPKAIDTDNETSDEEIVVDWNLK